MKIKYGLISCDSHGQVDRDAFTKRMSKGKFGDRIPHLIETKEKAHMAWPSERPVHRWLVNDMVVDIRSPSNCPALWDAPVRLQGPARLGEGPGSPLRPGERPKVLGGGRIDGQGPLPNPPVQNVT